MTDPSEHIVTAEPSRQAEKRLSPVLAASTRVLLPIIALASIVITLQGHNKPGGGFIGGLMLAAAVALKALTDGPAAARSILIVHPITIAVVGLALALASAFFAPDIAFFKAAWIAPNIPVLGEIKLGTPMLFDIGVFLVVVGSACIMFLTLLEHE
jgi:multicomponent Na+:H+ antiporter subunit B